MKKMGIVLVLLMLAPSLLAQERNRFIERRVKQMSRNLNLRIQTEAHRLSIHQLNQVQQQLQGLRQVLNGQHRPVPGPVPRPRPFPRLGSDLKKILLSGARAMSGSQGRAQGLRAAAGVAGSFELERLKLACEVSRSWMSEYRCYETGIGNMIDVKVDELRARKVILALCSGARSWMSQKNCFVESVKASDSAQLQRETIACQSMTSSQGSANCFQRLLK
jgi:hypothetical protein